MSVTLTINGETRTLNADPESPLLWALRDELNMTGTKFGCGIASCGACTVHLDGMPIRSCQTMVGDVEGAEIDSEMLDRFCEEHNFCGWFDTSAKLNTNIDKASEHLVGEILKHQSVFERARENDPSSFRPTDTEADQSGCC